MVHHSLRHYIDLVTEMPVNDLQVHDMDKPGTFPDVDRKLLNTPEHLKKIRKHFEKTPFTFNLYFYNLMDRDYLQHRSGRGEVSVDFTKQWQGDLATLQGLQSSRFVNDRLRIEIPDDPDAISVLYLSNADASDRAIPMTPWIVAHRFGHALTHNTKRREPTITGPIRELFQINQTLYNETGGDLGDYMTMRSARSGSSDEWAEEVIAQYLITGRVTLTPRFMDDQFVVAAETKMNAVIMRLLTACVGYIFVTI